jgi:hypothetical protein
VSPRLLLNFYIFALLTLGAPVRLHAGCGEALEAIQIPKFIFGDGIVQKDALPFMDAINDIDSFLGSLKKPDEASVLLKKYELSPEANYLNNRITTGVRKADSGSKKIDGKMLEVNYTKHPVHSIGLFAHEYGHLIFLENFSKVDIRMKRAFEANSRYHEATGKYLEIEKKIEAYPRKKGEDAGYQKLQRELDEVSASMQAIEQKWDEYLGFAAQEAPYAELFGDLTAVLHTERPDAMTDGLSFSKHKRAWEKRHSRSVGRQRNFTGRQPKYENEISRPVDFGGHNVLSATRKFIWDTYLSRPSILKENKAEVLEAVLNACANEIRKRFDHPQNDTVANWKKTNDDLNQQIVLELEKKGIYKDR